MEGWGGVQREVKGGGEGGEEWGSIGGGVGMLQTCFRLLSVVCVGGWLEEMEFRLRAWQNAVNSGHNVLPATPKGSTRTLLGPISFTLQ